MQLKIIIVGPKGSGKTMIGNYLSEQSQQLAVEKYNPTVGSRILVFQTPLRGVSEDVTIELWDNSGDSK